MDRFYHIQYSAQKQLTFFTQFDMSRQRQVIFHHSPDWSSKMAIMQIWTISQMGDLHCIRLIQVLQKKSNLSHPSKTYGMVRGHNTAFMYRIVMSPCP